MAKEETDITHNIMIVTSPMGSRLFKNVRGGAYPIAAVKPLLHQIVVCGWSSVISIARTLRPILFGLQCPGSSDLVGYTSIIITPAMAGKKIAIFTAIEVKTPTGKVQPDQIKFCDVVRKDGGISGIARSPEDAKKIIMDYCENNV